MFIVLITSITILIGVFVYKMELKPIQVTNSLPTQAPPPTTFTESPPSPAVSVVQLSPLPTMFTESPSSPTAFVVQPSPTMHALSNTELENLFGNPSCLWPCWQGVNPGVTTSSEALQRLDDSALVYSVIFKEPKLGFGSANWFWKIGDEQTALKGVMEWRKGIVFRIWQNLYPFLSIGEIIKRFGYPEKIDVYDCTEIVEGDPWWCATLFYANKGFKVDILWSGNGSDEVTITPSDPIKSIELFKPTTIEDWLFSNNRDIQSYNLQDWKGYGNLLDLYSVRYP